MEDAKLWIIGAATLVVIVAVLIWVLRQRDVPGQQSPRDYGAPEVTLTGTAASTGLTFGSDVDAEDAVVDQTVPLSRLGGAGWRDGGGVPATTPTDPHAGESPSWADDDFAGASPTDEHQVEVDQTGPRPTLDGEVDRERGGHW